jgi:hypothetical protein
MRCIQTFGLTPKGIARVFEINHDDIPVLEHAYDFQSFVSNTKIGEQAIAVIESAVVAGKKDKSEFQGHVFTVLYDKQIDSDYLYIYNSSDQDYNNLKEYFRGNFCLFVRNEDRQAYGDGSTTCFAYAIRDARMLKKQLALPSSEGRMPITENGSFSLSSDYLASITAFRKELFQTLILDTTDQQSLNPGGTQVP